MCHNNLIPISPTPSAQKSNRCAYTYSLTQLRQLNTKVNHDIRLKYYNQDQYHKKIKNQQKIKQNH